MAYGRVGRSTTMRGTKARSKGPGRTSMRGQSGARGLTGATPVSYNPNSRVSLLGNLAGPGIANVGRGAPSSAPKRVRGFRLPPTLDGQA